MHTEKFHIISSVNLHKINAHRSVENTTQIKKQTQPPRSPSPTWVTIVWICITAHTSSVSVIYINGLLLSVFFYVWLFSDVQETLFIRLSQTAL